MELIEVLTQIYKNSKGTSGRCNGINQITSSDFPKECSKEQFNFMLNTGLLREQYANGHGYYYQRTRKGNQFISSKK